MHVFIPALMGFYERSIFPHPVWKKVELIRLIKLAMATSLEVEKLWIYTPLHPHKTAAIRPPTTHHENYPS